MKTAGLVLFALILYSLYSDLNKQRKDLKKAQSVKETTLKLPQFCNVYLQQHKQTWDSASETYLPINENWEECMQVSRR